MSTAGTPTSIPDFPELLKFESTPEMEASEIYKQIRPEVERIMNAVVVEDFVQSAGFSRYERDKSRTLNLFSDSHLAKGESRKAKG